MKTLEEIKTLPKLQVVQSGDDGGMGYMALDASRPNKVAAIVWSNGGGWDHVSVSWPYRCPTWEEMCAVKRMFFNPDEVCVEYHPAESDYVNQHQYCLHIWHNQTAPMPTPPSWMVGVKPGQTIGDIFREALRAFKETGG